VHINIAYNPSIFYDSKKIIISGNGTYFTTKNNMLVALMIVLSLGIFSLSSYICILYFKNRRLDSKTI